MAGSEALTGLPVRNIRQAAVAAGIKKLNSDLDMVLLEAPAGSSVAATFTRNRFEAAPVRIAREHLAARDASQASYLLINSGNANAGTGAQGLDDAQRCCEGLAHLANVPTANVLPFSTGVIGELLPLERMQAALPGLLAGLSADNWQHAASGIMTTDTVPKLYSEQFEMFGQQYSITGISKGAGMIQPNMATMLCYIACDVSVEQAVLQTVLSEAVEASFNRITVDGDTSTNDACVLLASGREGKAQSIHSESQPEYQQFQQIVQRACLDLAQQIIRDAEGASKFVSVQVEQGATESDCLAVAYTIAHSPLVKTALFAEDPNWGRILAAIGRAPIAQLDIDAVSLSLDEVLLAERGALAQSYDEAAAAAVMKQAEFTLHVGLGAGSAQATVWTCDLSHDYVSINADYRS